VGSAETFPAFRRPWGRPPNLDEDRDWILHSFTEDRVGSAYDISLTWMSSGPGGWDAQHYNPKRGEATA
jgi:hypothetical protein